MPSNKSKNAIESDSKASQEDDPETRRDVLDNEIKAMQKPDGRA